jgi:Fe-S cluster assembly iron-binding protein IscA
MRKKFALHLDGTTIDFQDGPLGRGFTIDNPNYALGGGCPGCGGH